MEADCLISFLTISERKFQKSLIQHVIKTLKYIGNFITAQDQILWLSSIKNLSYVCAAWGAYTPPDIQKKNVIRCTFWASFGRTRRRFKENLVSKEGWKIALSAKRNFTLQLIPESCELNRQSNGTSAFYKNKNRYIFFIQHDAKNRKSNHKEKWSLFLEMISEVGFYCLSPT